MKDVFAFHNSQHYEMKSCSSSTVDFVEICVEHIG